MAGATRTCPSCGSPAAPGDHFCESCGEPIDAATASPTGNDPAATPPAIADPMLDGARTHLVLPPGAADADSGRLPLSTVCASCGGEVDDERWCTVCGARAPSERDHWAEQPAAWVGAVCDRGIRHTRNEDAMATAADAAPDSFCALVVCDGVTTAAASDVASLAAAIAARDLLSAARAHAPEGSPSGRIVHWTAEIEAASLAANAAATEVASTVPADAEPPSCTFVTAVLDGPFVVAGWVGDSRAYWLPDSGVPLQLTVDDSWATDQVALGMPRDEAEDDTRAHSITRWLGIDAPDPTARCASTSIDGPGWLLVCSDGLWNYCSPAADLRALVEAEVARLGDDPLAVADALVAFANEQGGQDNITVALARVTSTPSIGHTAAERSPANSARPTKERPDG
jgi:serine/threonine protein phosphatase PrpC